MEDDATTEAALRKLFLRKGWQVVSVGTIQDALGSLSPVPDVIILDLMLPDGSGEDVLRTVRSTNMATKVAVCTGVSEAARLQNVQDLKPEAILKKPVEISRLVQICNDAVQPDSGT